MRLRHLLPIVVLVVATLLISPERIMGTVTGDFGYRLAAAAIDGTRTAVIYDPAYRVISYPWGDVPANRGVCTDVVIRAYRQLGIDLQQRYHESLGGDPNIAHRRVTNLRKFFAKHGQSLGPSRNPSRFKPGDIVTFVNDKGITHIAIVTARRSWDWQRPLIVHNEGLGQKLDDALFESRYRMTGHYRYHPRETGKRG